MKAKAAFFVCILAVSAFSVKRYYSISQSVRAHGMGGAFYGLSDDEYALFYNPAGLGVYRGGGQFFLSTRASMTTGTPGSISTLSNAFSSGGSKTTTQLVTDLLSLQGKPLGGNVSFMPSFITKKFAIGILLPDVKADISVLGAGLDTSLEATMIADGGLYLSFAKNFMNDQLSIGLTPKLVARAGGTKAFSTLEIIQGTSANLDINSIGGAGAGFDADLGATYRVYGLPFGAANRASMVFGNLLATNYPIGTSSRPPGLTRTVSLGWLTVFKGVSVIHNFNVVADIAEFGIGGESDSDRGGRGGSFFKHLNFGVEAPVWGWLVPRTGFHQGNLCAGLGIRTRLLQLDYAFFGDELMSGVGRYTAYSHELRLAFGFSAAIPPPLESDRPESKPSGFEVPAIEVKTPQPSSSPSPTPEVKRPELPRAEVPKPAPTETKRGPQSVPQTEQSH